MKSFLKSSSDWLLNPIPHLRFVSGRSRLPNDIADVSQRFQIMKTDKSKDGLPTSQTCFFQLRLPDYSSEVIMEER